MATIKRTSLVDQVYEDLRDRIVRLDIPFGKKLTLIKLQEEYNVSSTPVREALNRLMNEGLIDFENNVGAKIIDISETDVIEIQELAGAYEMAAAYYAMEKTDAEQLAEEINFFIEEYRGSSELTKSCTCIRDIKAVFYKHADNERLTNISSSLQGVEGILHNLFIHPGEKEGDVYLSGIVYFEKIQKAVCKKDFAAVCDGLEEYRKWAGEYIIKNLNYIKSINQEV